MTSPHVTVVLPTYNWSTVLPYSIGSVLRQSFADWELLVVGDGCSDDSAAVVGRFDDRRVRWIGLPVNSGHQSAPNNEGIRQARGELIAYLGHDDLWLPHHLALLVAAIDGGAGIAYGITEMVAAGGSPVVPAPWGLATYSPGMWIPPTGVVHRKRLVAEVGGWRSPREVAIDPEAELWRRMAAAGAPIAFVRRLTAIKFPASARRDVYRLRPHDEQSAWFERIGREPDFEAVELARLLAFSEAASLRTLARRELARLGWSLRSAVGYRRHVFDRRRKRKGLAPLAP